MNSNKAEQICCERRCTTREEMRIAHGDPQQFWEALLEANTDGFVTMMEAESEQRRYEAIFNAALETTQVERGYVEQWCQTCGLVCTSSTITRDRADEYSKHCPKCDTDTMVMQRWVSLDATKEG